MAVITVVVGGSSIDEGFSRVSFEAGGFGVQSNVRVIRFVSDRWI